MKHLTIATGIVAVVPAFAGDGGDPNKYRDVPPAVRDWFRGVRSPQGVPCCDIADGSRVDWRRDGKGNEFSVFIGDAWRQVPKAAVVAPGTGNPTGDAVVWYVDNKVEGPNRYFIRCFVPGPEQ
jgi:hypothetical protein